MRRIEKRNMFDIILRVYQAINCSCYICGEHLPEHEITKDHVFPRSLGYMITMNMMPAHHVCNRNKGDRLPTQQEIQTSCEAYDVIGQKFQPRIINETKMWTKPLSALLVM